MKTAKVKVPDYFEENENISKIVHDLVESDFSHLINAKFGVLVKISEKQIPSATPAKLYVVPNFQRYFSALDYILVIENAIIRELDNIQLENLIFRTLCYADVTENGEYKKQKADIEMFKPEISRYGEEGLFDLKQVISAVKNKARKKPIEDIASIEEGI